MKKSLILATLFVVIGGTVAVSAQTQTNVPPKSKPKTNVTPPSAKIKTQKPNGKATKKTNPKDAVPAVQGVLLTPPETVGGVSDQLVDDIIRVLQRRLLLTGEYSGVFMRSSLSTIKRGVTDKRLTSADIEKPFVSNVKLEKLSTVAGYKSILTSSVSDYKYDEAKKNVTFDLTLRWLDFSTGKATARAASETFVGKPGSKGQTEVQIALDTIRDAAEKLSKQLIPVPEVELSPKGSKK